MKKINNNFLKIATLVTCLLALTPIGSAKTHHASKLLLSYAVDELIKQVPSVFRSYDQLAEAVEYDSLTKVNNTTYQIKEPGKINDEKIVDYLNVIKLAEKKYASKIKTSDTNQIQENNEEDGLINLRKKIEECFELLNNTHNTYLEHINQLNQAYENNKGIDNNFSINLKNKSNDLLNDLADNLVALMDLTSKTMKDNILNSTHDEFNKLSYTCKVIKTVHPRLNNN